MDEISLADVWRTLTRHWKIIFATTLAGIVTTVLVALLTRPVYRVEALVAPVAEDQRNGLSAFAGQFGELAALAGINLRGGGGSKDEAIALLKSRSLTEKFIDDNHLLPVLFADDWDAVAGQWRAKDPQDVPTMWAAYRLFDEEIRSVTENPKTGLVTIAVEWTDPEQAKTWTDQLIQAVNLEMRIRAIREAERSLTYLNEQLLKTDVVELKQAIFRLVESQTKQMMLANVREDYAFKVIDPAAVPDADDPIRPSPSLLLFLGSLAGLTMGVVIAFLLGARRGFDSN